MFMFCAGVTFMRNGRCSRKAVHGVVNFKYEIDVGIFFMRFASQRKKNHSLIRFKNVLFLWDSIGQGLEQKIANIFLKGLTEKKEKLEC